MWPLKTKREFENELNGESRAKASMFLQDICDVCFQTCWVKRAEMSKRLKGHIVVCDGCAAARDSLKPIIKAWRFKPTQPV